MKSEVHSDVLAILEAPGEERAPKAMGISEAGLCDAVAVLSPREKYRKRLRTTISIERPNKEIRRRERVIGIFPNRESVTRLVGTLLMDRYERWALGQEIP